MIKKIFWVVLIITVCVWIGVGIYYFKPSTPQKVQLPSPSPIPPFPTQALKDLWQTYETFQFSIKYPQGWDLVPGEEDDHPFDLTPPPEERQLYDGIALYLGKNTLNLSSRRWAELDFAEKEATPSEEVVIPSHISFEEIPIQEKVGIKVKDEKEGILRVYLSDGAETMYIFFLKGRNISAKVEDKFVEIVSTLELKK